jgi:hypothetical protein
MSPAALALTLLPLKCGSYRRVALISIPRCCCRARQHPSVRGLAGLIVERFCLTGFDAQIISCLDFNGATTGNSRCPQGQVLRCGECECAGSADLGADFFAVGDVAVVVGIFDGFVVLTGGDGGDLQVFAGGDGGGAGGGVLNLGGA